MNRVLLCPADGVRSAGELTRLLLLYGIFLSSVRQVGCSQRDVADEDSHVPPEELVSSSVGKDSLAAFDRFFAKGTAAPAREATAREEPKARLNVFDKLFSEPAPESEANARSRINRSCTPEFAPLRVDTIWRRSCAQYAICVVLNGMGYPTDYDKVSRKMNPRGEGDFWQADRGLSRSDYRGAPT